MKKLLITPLLLATINVVHAETVFVTLEKDNALAIMNPTDGKLLKTISVGKRPRGIALSPDNKTLYIATSDDNTIKIFDAETLKQTGKGVPLLTGRKYTLRKSKTYN
jgi:DNA-binding beta-propeller fold protein YncE